MRRVPGRPFYPHVRSYTCDHGQLRQPATGAGLLPCRPPVWRTRPFGGLTQPRQRASMLSSVPLESFDLGTGGGHSAGNMQQQRTISLWRCEIMAYEMTQWLMGPDGRRCPFTRPRSWRMGKGSADGMQQHR